MATTEFVPNQAATENVTAHVLWMTIGLSCEGDSVAMTSATNPSLEDIIQGVIPGMPRVVIHNQVIAFEVGDEYMQAWYDAEQGKLDPFVLVVEGSLGNEQINGEGHWTGFGVNPDNGQPITLNEWVDRLAPKAAAVVAVGTCATYGGIPAMRNNPTGAMGLPDYLGWKWRSKANLPVICIPGCPAQPDNMTETLMYLVFHLAGMAPAPDLDEQLRPSGCSAARCARAATAPGSPNRATSPPSMAPTTAASSNSAARARWSSATYPSADGSTASAAVRTSAGSAWRARCPASLTSTCRSWTPTNGVSRPRTSSASRTGRCSATSASATSRRSTTSSPSGGVPGRFSQAVTRSAGEAHLPTATPDQGAFRPWPPRQQPTRSRRQGDVLGSDHADLGSLGIYTEIDFSNQRVNKCYSTSMIFRGFDIFMKGIDPRDAHFITSRICGTVVTTTAPARA